ncbi:retrotransposon gag domain-containing protein, partial [Vibrio vulnificus]|nr:retrotransposon gag domain-containing protein [Vibrio vulnificus]
MGSCTSAKDMWDRLRVTYEGTNQVRETKINVLLHEYEMFAMKEGESINGMLDRFGEIMNGLSSLGRTMTDSDQVKKILRSL